MGERKQVEWHLTPRGWEKGQLDPPADRVLTMACEEDLTTIRCQEAWSSPRRAQIKDLLERFGHGPARQID